MLKISIEKENTLKDILKSEKNKKLIVDIISKIFNVEILDIKYIKTQKMKSLSEYEFSLIKMKGIISTKNSVDIYFKVVNKNQIKESIFCYWYLLYQEEKEQKKVDVDSIINNVSITELGTKKYQKGILLENKISNNNILEYGTEVHFIDFFKFVESCNKDYEKIENKYVKEGGEDILLIGLKLNQDLKNKIIKL